MASISLQVMISHYRGAPNPRAEIEKDIRSGDLQASPAELEELRTALGIKSLTQVGAQSFGGRSAFRSDDEGTKGGPAAAMLTAAAYKDRPDLAALSQLEPSGKAHEVKQEIEALLQSPLAQTLLDRAGLRPGSDQVLPIQDENQHWGLRSLGINSGGLFTFHPNQKRSWYHGETFKPFGRDKYKPLEGTEFEMIDLSSLVKILQELDRKSVDRSLSAEPIVGSLHWRSLEI